MGDALRHGPFFVEPMQKTQAPAALSVSAARFLKTGGVLRERDEEPRERRKRMQTALMVGFRDTQRADLFEALYRLSYREVRAFVGATRRGSARVLDPDDITQEVFLNIFLSIESISIGIISCLSFPLRL